MLGQDGKFLLRSDGGSADPIPDDEWNTPAGYYDANTQTTGAGNTAYLRSVTPATLAGITANDLFIVAGSDITIQSSNSVGAEAKNLTIGSSDGSTSAKFTATGTDIGIHFTGLCTLEQNAVVSATGQLFGIKYDGPATPYDGHNFQLLAQSQLTAASSGGIAVAVDVLELNDAVLNANGDTGGILVGQGITLVSSDNTRSSITANTNIGKAISCDALTFSGSDIVGISENGDAGIHANRFIGSFGNNPSSIRGKALSGYGIVALNLSGEETDFPSGSITLGPAPCTLEGTVGDGAGICTNQFDGGTEAPIVGTADTGFGILADWFSLSEDNFYLEGTSKGATANPLFQKDGGPHCAGMNIGTLSVIGSGQILATAPKSVSGSYGIYSLSENGPYVHGSISLVGTSAGQLSLKASGEIGIFTQTFIPRGIATIEATGALHGIDVFSFSIVQTKGTNQITAIGDTGCGVHIDCPDSSSRSALHLERTNLTATGAEYGIYLSTNEYISIDTDSTVVAEAVGAQGKAGFFAVSRKTEYSDIMQVQDSNFHAKGPIYGLYLKDMYLSVSAAKYSLSAPGECVGTGSESGILIDFPKPAGYKAGLMTSNMKLPDGTFYTIKGVSTGVEPDKIGRKGAISLSSSSIEGGALLIEEYTLPAKGSLGDTPYAVYALNMNIEDYTQYEWRSPEIQLEAQKDGLMSKGSGALGASITAERTSKDTANIIHLIDGTHQVHLTADANIATVQFNANGGVPAPADQKVGIGGYVTQPPEMKKDGFAFAGWFEADTQHKWDFTVDTVQSSLLKLEARWTANSYTLTFEGNADGDPSLSGMPTDNPLHLAAGALIPKPKETPTRTGMQFQFWADDPKGTTPWNFDDTPMPAKDMSLYAIWKAQVYEVVYDSMGGTPPTQKEEVPYQEKVPGKIQTPTRDNYKFEGWFLDKETTQPWDKDTPMPDHNITLYAKWSRTNAVLSFDANGGDAKSVPSSRDVVPGSPVNIADYQPGGNYAPYYDGYFFIGWLDPAGNVVQDIFDMPNNNLQLKAQWREAPSHSLPQYLVMYQNTKKPADIEKELHYVYEYTDLLGRAQQLQPHYQWDTSILSSGGTTDITVDFWSGDSRTSGLHSIVKLYVLHETQLLTKEDTATFAFGASISKDGSEWHPSCAEEVPDFTSGTIKTRNLPIVFRLNGTDMRTAGTYHPEFDVTYTDYFGTVHQLKKEVTAIVLSKDTPVSSSSSSSTSSSPTSRSSSSSSPPASRSSSQPTQPIDSLAPASQLPQPPSQTNDGILQELEEAGDPILQLGNAKVPLFSQGQERVWGLLNLLLLLLSLVGCILLGIYAWRHKLVTLQTEQRKGKIVFALCLLSLLALPAMLILFLVTQNLHYLMVLIDKRTPWMLLIAILQLASGLAVFLWTRTAASDANSSHWDT